MSHCSGEVKFTDGTVMHYEYDGTSDVVVPKLYSTHEEMIENWRKYKYKEVACDHDLEDVTLYCDHYGTDFPWKGTACRKCNMIIDGRSSD